MGGFLDGSQGGRAGGPSRKPLRRVAALQPSVTRRERLDDFRRKQPSPVSRRGFSSRRFSEEIFAFLDWAMLDWWGYEVKFPKKEMTFQTFLHGFNFCEDCFGLVLVPFVGSLLRDDAYRISALNLLVSLRTQVYPNLKKTTQIASVDRFWAIFQQ